MENEKDNSIEYYLDQLKEFIKTKKKENEVLKTMLDTINMDNKTKSSIKISKKK
jgi:hypothetical protein